MWHLDDEARRACGYRASSCDSLTRCVFELEGTAYREAARVTGDQAWTAARPFAVSVVPAELVTS